MATLFNNKISATYEGLIKTIDNSAITSALKEITDGGGNQTGLFLNSAGDFKVTNILEFSTLKDSNNVEIKTWITSTDGIENFDNNISIPTSAAVKLYVDTKFATTDTLAEVLVFGNTTSGTDIEITAGDDIKISDSSKLLFGNGFTDFEIYHDGTGSFISDLGTGNLEVRSNLIKILGANDESMILAQQDNGVRLFCDNSKKFETTSVGATVTGSLTVTNKILGVLDTTVTGTTQAVANNSTLIATTAYADAANLVQINSNAANIATNVTNIATNASNIATNVSNISSNLGFITTNTTSISNNALAISENASSIALKLPLAGGILTGNVRFNDNVKANFGNGDDLEIYHDSTHNFIKGVPNLYVQTNGLFNVETVSESDMIKATAGDAVELYFAGNKKFSTSATGVEVIGDQTTEPFLVINNTSNSARVNGVVLGRINQQSATDLTKPIVSSIQFSERTISPTNSRVGVGMDFYVGSSFSDNITRAMRISAGGNVGFGAIQPEAPIHVYGLNAKIILQNQPSIPNGYAAMFTGANNALKFSAGSGNGVTLMELAGNERDISVFGALVIDNGDGTTSTNNYLYTIEPGGRNIVNAELKFKRKIQGVNGSERTYMTIAQNPLANNDPKVQIQTALEVTGTAFNAPAITSIKKDIEITSNVGVADKGLILSSPDGTRYRITVANGGTLSVAVV